MSAPSRLLAPHPGVASRSTLGVDFPFASDRSWTFHVNPFEAELCSEATAAAVSHLLPTAGDPMNRARRSSTRRGEGVEDAPSPS